MPKSPVSPVIDLKTSARLQPLVKACRSNLSKGRPLFTGLKDEEISLLQERYSRFVDERDEDGMLNDSVHQIHHPFTPRPFFLGLSNLSLNGERYGTVWSQNGGGYSFLHVLRGGEITRNGGSPYKPMGLNPGDYRLFFLREKSPSGTYASLSGEKADVWSLFPLYRHSGAEYAGFGCRQARSHLVTTASSRDIESTLSVTVPKGHSAEIWELRLRNTASKKRGFTLFVKVAWDLRTYPSPRLNRVESFNVRADAKNGMIAASNIDFANKNRRTAFLLSLEKFSGFDFSSECGDGRMADGVVPQCMADGALKSEAAVPVGEDLIGALQFDLTLKPGGEKTLSFALGAVSGGFEEAAKAAQGIRGILAGGKGFGAVVRKNEEGWKEMSARHLVRTPDQEFDRLFNVWSPCQLMQTASFLSGSPKTEFRERMQILTALTPFLPSEVKGLLRDALSCQLKDGRILNRFPNFKGDTPDEEMSMDNAVWLADAVCRYVNETGDAAFLDETIGFYDPAMGAVDVKKGAKVYDHVMAAVRCLFDYRGRFGLCKVGSRDCNPALIRLSKLGGISAWLSMALVRTAFQLFPVCRLKNQKRDVGYLNTVVDNMFSNLNNYSWNGAHYTYAYDDNGNPIGNKTDKEGAVYLTANLWAVICGAAKQGGNLDATIAIINKLDTAFGHRSIFPAYNPGFSAKGGIPDLLPGTFENGSIDAFNRAYAVMAFAEAGLGDKAYETLKKGLASATIPDISTASPTQLSEFIIGPDHPDFGRSVYDIYNPAISWIRLAMERMIGVLPVLEGVLLSPCVPAAWTEFSVRRVFRGQSYSIRFHNPDRKCSGVKKVTVNGRELEKGPEGHIIDLSKAPGQKNKPVCVDVLMG